MANIASVDYESIPGKTRRMKDLGGEIGTTLSSAYSSIEHMHSVWYGKRYSELVKQFNGLKPKLDELLNLILKELPVTLETIANNYSNADKGMNVCTPTEGEKKVIQVLDEHTGDVGLKFITEEVEEVRQTVIDKISKAKDKINLYENEFNSIEWRSGAADTFRNKFKTLKNEIYNSFENLSTSFSELMNKTLEDVQTAETNNTVS